MLPHLTEGGIFGVFASIPPEPYRGQYLVNPPATQTTIAPHYGQALGKAMETGAVLVFELLAPLPDWGWNFRCFCRYSPRAISWSILGQSSRNSNHDGLVLGFWSVIFVSVDWCPFQRVIRTSGFRDQHPETFWGLILPMNRESVAFGYILWAKKTVRFQGLLLWVHFTHKMNPKTTDPIWGSVNQRLKMPMKIIGGMDRCLWTCNNLSTKKVWKKSSWHFPTKSLVYGKYRLFMSHPRPSKSACYCCCVIWNFSVTSACFVLLHLLVWVRIFVSGVVGSIVVSDVCRKNSIVICCDWHKQGRKIVGDHWWDRMR